MPRGETTIDRAEVEQQAARLVPQTDMEQRIAEDPIDQRGREHAGADHRPRTGGLVGIPGMENHLGRQPPGLAARLVRRCRCQESFGRAVGVAYQYRVDDPSGPGRPHPQARAFQRQRLAHDQGVTTGIQQSELPSAPGTGNVARRRGADDRQRLQIELVFGGLRQIRIPGRGLLNFETGPPLSRG